MDGHRSLDSSNLTSAAYDPTTQTLEVAFTSGGVYQYANVRPELYEQLLTADSPGRFFAAHIKSAHSVTRV